MEDNKLIAEFMGAKTRNEASESIGDRMNYNQFWIPFHGIKYESEMKYHKSYDWLIPVIDHIEKLSFNGRQPRIQIRSFNIFEERVNYEVYCFIYKDGTDGDPLLEYTTKWEESRLEAVYKFVVYFINWYNTQNHG